MTEAGALQATILDRPDIRHAFFTRQGGVSQGMYASLNGGVGSRDDAGAVAANRKRMADTLKVEPECLLVPYQVHSAQVQVVDAVWLEGARPRVDGLVTATPGLALGVTGADCGMILFADLDQRVIGACHAGWRGAFEGILEATVGAMEDLGAQRAGIVAVLGPTIGAASYEVGDDFAARFRDADAANARFFAAAQRAGHLMFDLPAYIAARLNGAGIAAFHDLGCDTYAEEARCFSYRRSVHRGEADYGRLVSAIALV